MDKYVNTYQDLDSSLSLLIANYLTVIDLQQQGQQKMNKHRSGLMYICGKRPTALIKFYTFVLCV